jgi:hypothetical protein
VTRRLGDRSRLILRQRVQGSARAVRAVQNTRVIQTETRVVTDANLSVDNRLQICSYSYEVSPIAMISQSEHFALMT